ncbi:MAG TPA: helix-turn-helix domain-containing protein [Lachnospiraceae bacterium]|jgi:excisionase family DNA binding protein|nr:helix-turn-helix domain-containing protein [Lachnospiraceae bacterium]
MTEKKELNTSIDYQNDAEEKWVSMKELAEHLGVSEDTIRTWTRKGYLPFSKIGKSYKYKKSEVDAWARAGRIKE